MKKPARSRATRLLPRARAGAGDGARRRRPRARRGGSALAVLLLCVVAGAAAATFALAAGATARLDHRATHIAKHCKRSRRHRCPRTHGLRPGAPAKPNDTRRRVVTAPAATGGAAAPVGGSQAPGAPIMAPGPGGASASGGGTPAPETPAGPSAPVHVQVTAQDTEGFRYVLSRTTVPAGEVVIEFVNHGQDEHNLHALEPGEVREAGSLPNTVPGAHPQLKLDLRPGSYTLFCSLPGHEAKGMKATLVVR